MYESVSNPGQLGPARFRSAPSTWLDALLDDPDSLKLLNPNPNPMDYMQVQPTTPNPGLKLLNPNPNLMDYMQPTTPNPGFYGREGGGSSPVFGIPSRKRSREPDRGELTKANSLIEMEMDKILEDSVPCKVRAKRGFATHPRSIAERVRRTKISERIRKLQELVPDMDKQTNTADMLEEAVDYVKNLQRQIQELTEQQHKCKCSQQS